MLTPKTRKKSEKVKAREAAGWPRYDRSHINLRFADLEHRQLVRDAAERCKVSMNAWLVRVTLDAARSELKKG